MNVLTVEHTHNLFVAQAHTAARIQRLMGRNKLALVTPELEKELKQAAQIAQLIDLAMDEWMDITGE